MAKNLGAMFLAKNMAFWALRTIAKLTKTPVDDALLKLAESIYEGDSEGVKASIEIIVKHFFPGFVLEIKTERYIERKPINQK